MIRLAPLLLAIAVGYLSLACIALLWADRLIFLPPAATYRASDLGVQLIRVDAERHVAALWLANPDAACTLLFSHGNGEDLGYINGFLRQLREQGFSVLAYDYRGYGASTGGLPGERATYRDIEAVYAHAVRELGIPPERLIVHGRSVGTGPSLHLATSQPIGGLVLESGFTSAFRVVTRVPLLPFDRFPNLRRIGRVRVPVLVLHGTADRVIPVRMGRQLFEAAREPKTAVWIEGAGHNDLAWVAGARYGAALRAFAAQVGCGQTATL